MSMLSMIAARLDGFRNTMLGIGGSKDPTVYTTYLARPRLGDSVLSALMRQDHFASAAVESVVLDAIAPSWELRLEASSPAEVARIRKAYAMREDALGVPRHMFKGASWGRAFGGAVTWIGVAGNQELPLDLDDVPSVRFLETHDRRQVTPTKYYEDPNAPNYGRPEVYRITPRRGGLTKPTLVHASRLVIWRGQPTDDETALELLSWDDSILERCWDALKEVGQDYASKTRLLNRVSQSVYKIFDLWGLITARRSEDVEERIRLMDLSRNNANAILLSAGKADGSGAESYENITTPIAGVPEIVSAGVQRLAAASRTPMSILMGLPEPAGSSGLERWASWVTAWRWSDLRPQHERIARVILCAKDGPTRGKEPETWRISYGDVRTLTPEQRASVRKTVADTDAVYIDKGVAKPVDIALSRFGADGWSPETTLDPEIVDANLKRQRAELNAPVKDNAELGTVGARDGALQLLQKAFFSGQIPEDAALARLELIFRFSSEDAKRFIARPAGWSPAPDPDAKSPGPAPGPARGEGAGAPPPLAGFNDGGDPKTKALPAEGAR